MSVSPYDSYDYMDSAETIERRNDRQAELSDDLKCRISSAVREWLRANNVQLEDPMWASFGARSQECLETLVLGRLFDTVEDISGDFLGSV